MNYNKDLSLFYDIINKYKKINVICSKVKYNFIIDLLNNFDNINFLMTIQEKVFISNNKIPEIKLNNKNCKFNVSNILFLKENDFNSDINLLSINVSLNVNTFFNGLIIDTNNFNIICMPLKKLVNTQFNLLKNYNDVDVTKEFDIIKLYDGCLLNLYYHNNNWHLSDSKCISYNNKNMDILENRLTFEEHLIDMLKDNNINTNKLFKGYTYIIYITNKNYNLSYGKNKLKFIKHIDNVKHDYNELNDCNKSQLNYLYDNIQIKKKISIHTKSKYGIILINKTQNNDNKLIEFPYYKKINKILHTPIDEYGGDVNIKYIALRAIIKYKLLKNDIINNFTFLIRYYNYIHNEINKIIIAYINIVYDFITIDTPYLTLIHIIDDDIKKDKKNNDLFYNSNIQSDICNLKSILKDYIMQIKYINIINNNILTI